MARRIIVGMIALVEHLAVLAGIGYLGLQAGWDAARALPAKERDLLLLAFGLALLLGLAL